MRTVQMIQAGSNYKKWLCNLEWPRMAPSGSLTSAKQCRAHPAPPTEIVLDAEILIDKISMTPEALAGSYQRYKSDTNVFMTWLGQAAAACG